MAENLANLILLLSESILDERLVIDYEEVGLTSSSVTQCVHRFLSFDFTHLDSTQRDAVIRLVVHLSPPEAIIYDSLNPKPRWSLINNYILSSYGVNPEICERISRKIAVVLDVLETERRSEIRGFRDRLMQVQRGRCASCGFLFGKTASYIDLYKPYFESWDELTEAEVDHIKPVSGLGDNSLKNLQLLCRLCNWGKGFGLVPSALEEYRFAALPLASIERYHRSRCFYYVVSRDRKCQVCGSESNSLELTVRKINLPGPYAISNLRAICRNCVDDAVCCD
jgi:5-methylcytosine-specific restriction endonuclease McrA